MSRLPPGEQFYRWLLWLDERWERVEAVLSRVLALLLVLFTLSILIGWP